MKIKERDKYMMTSYEKRMYFLVPYNISPIQQAIQAGHAALEYAHKFNNNPIFKDFIENHKTWIILNGGTTNNSIETPGTLQLSLKELYDYNKLNLVEIPFATFKEPDLNDALTAICFICDQRVWDRKLVPEWESYRDDYYSESDGHTDMDIDELREEWLMMIGGEINNFLRELIRGKKLA